MRERAAAAVAGCAAALLATSASGASLMDWPDLLGRPMPAPTEKIAYGPDPMQFGELWLPEGKGPFPVVLTAHGGCWLSAVANLSIMNYAAEDLRRRGIAVWNIEYRGVEARMQSPRLSTIVLPAAGHVELIAPGTAAWNQVVESLNALLH
jgi:acetyl esterase/lipase